MAQELRTAAARHGRRLQYVTIAWNSLECLVALIAGFLAGSVALVGFGFDSAIEVASSLAALWRLRRDADEGRREAAERQTLRIIGGCFLLLAAYVAYGAIRALLERRVPEPSTIGIVIAALSLIVMPLLVHFKRRIASRLGSGALEAEARQTRICAYLSASFWPVSVSTHGSAGGGLIRRRGCSWCRSSPGKARRRFAGGRAATDRAGDGSPAVAGFTRVVHVTPGITTAAGLGGRRREEPRPQQPGTDHALAAKPCGAKRNALANLLAKTW